MQKINETVLLERRISAREYSKCHPPKEKLIKICCVDGCMNECTSFSFCNRHYQEWMQYGRILSPTPPESLPNEKWEDVVDYVGLYKVSNFGRVWSLSRFVTRKGNPMVVREKIMAPSVDKKGYTRVALSDDNGHKSVLVHRLVAKAFLPNPDNKPQINHIDGNPTNNSASNLEWCDQSWQEIHKIYNLGVKNSSLLSQPKKIKNMETGEIFNSLGEASKKTSVPMHILFNRLKTGKADKNGHHWKYMVN